MPSKLPKVLGGLISVGVVQPSRLADTEIRIPGSAFGEARMPRRVYDCVLFNGEFDTLAIRMQELAEVVYKFVVVESNETFSGLPKSVAFSIDHHAIKGFADRIVFVLVDDMPAGNDAWQRESWQRNAVLRGLTDASDDDLVLMSDVDEIPRATCVQQALADPEALAFGFRMKLYYFFLNYRNTAGASNSIWAMGARRDFLRSHMPDTLRYEIRKGVIDARIFDEGGWHFSYLMDEAAVMEKIRSFSHQEFNDEAFLTTIDIGRLVTRSGDLFGRPGYEWAIVIERDLPRYISAHKADFKKYFFHGSIGPGAIFKQWARFGRETMSHQLRAILKGFRPSSIRN
jgi:hypothetical protein